MKIDSDASSFYLPEINGNKKSKDNFDSRQNSPDVQDSISISAEAFALAQEMYVKEKVDYSQPIEESGDISISGRTTSDIFTRHTQDTKQKSYIEELNRKKLLDMLNGDSEPAENVAAPSKPMASDPQKQLDDVEKKIKALQGQIEKVASSELPEMTKEVQINGLQSQISELLSQKSKLENTITSNAKNSSKK